MSAKVLSRNKSEFWLSILKGTIYAITCSLVLILIFALLIRFLNIPDGYIMPINQAIKIISLFFGCFLSLRGKEKGFIKGIIIGILYSFLSYIIFSFLCGNFSFELTTITDLIFSAFIGGLCGIICVNTKSGRSI